MRRIASRSRVTALLLCIVGFGLVGCLGRTGIGGDELEAIGATPGGGVDGSAASDGLPASDSAAPLDDTTVEPGDSGGPAVDSGSTKDSFIDIFDVIPIPEGGVLGDCAGCVRDNCGTQVNKCINDPKCRSGLTCAVTKCFAGGAGKGLDFACITGCFGGDFGAALTAVNAFTCVTSKCGMKCGGLLGGLPGGGGGGGKPGGLPAEMSTPEELMSIDPSTRIPFDPESLSPWAAEIHAEARLQASCAPVAR